MNAHAQSSSLIPIQLILLVPIRVASVSIAATTTKAQAWWHTIMAANAKQLMHPSNLMQIP